MTSGSPRLVAYGWGLGLVLLSIWPVFRVPPVDSYPLSTYPMFSQRRGQPTLYRMLALDDQKTPAPLPPRLVANSEALQAAATIRRAVDGGKSAQKALCSEIAARVSRDPELPHVRRLQIQAVRYDPIEYFVGDRVPLEARTLHSCRVRR